MSFYQVTSADEVVKTMLDHMTNPDSQSHLPLKSGPLSLMHHVSLYTEFLMNLNLACESFFSQTGDSVVLCVNNLGALSCLEMAVVARAAIFDLGNCGCFTRLKRNL